MGIGKLTIADRDYVEWSNLQRQSYIQKKMRNSVNQKQLQQREHVRKINSEVEIVPVVTDVTMREIEELTKDVISY